MLVKKLTWLTKWLNLTKIAAPTIIKHYQQLKFDFLIGELTSCCRIVVGETKSLRKLDYLNVTTVESSMTNGQYTSSG